MTHQGISFDYLVGISIKYVANRLRVDLKLNYEQAVKKFMATKTCALLLNEKSKLYLESDEYIYDMLQSEYRGDVKNWLEI